MLPAETAEAWKTRTFTAEELKKYNGKDGMPVYAAVDGIVYDLSKSKYWKTGKHMKMHDAGSDLSEDIHKKAPQSIHRDGKILERMRDVAAEQGLPFEPDRADNLHRLNMGVFPAGATLIPNPYNKIPGLSVGHVHFVPGFPVMAWPMIEWVLDRRYAHLHGGARTVERSVIVFGAMEASLTPLMEDIETRFPGVKVFSLPSVDHPQWGRHIELGVKAATDPAEAFAALRAGLDQAGVKLGAEMVR